MDYAPEYDRLCGSLITYFEITHGKQGAKLWFTLYLQHRHHATTLNNDEQTAFINGLFNGLRHSLKPYNAAAINEAAFTTGKQRDQYGFLGADDWRQANGVAELDANEYNALIKKYTPELLEDEPVSHEDMWKNKKLADLSGDRLTKKKLARLEGK